MKVEALLPVCSLLLNVGCTVGYAFAENWPKSAYWLGAAIINTALLFM